MIMWLVLAYIITFILSVVGFCKLTKMNIGSVNEVDVAFMILLSLAGPISLLACIVEYLLGVASKISFTKLTKLTKLINEKL